MTLIKECLILQDTADISVPDGTEVLCLRPQDARVLEEKGQAFQFLSDYLPPMQVMEAQEPILAGQLMWLESIDYQLREISSTLRLQDFSGTLASMLKWKRLLDAQVELALSFFNYCQQKKPSSVVFLRCKAFPLSEYPISPVATTWPNMIYVIIEEICRMQEIPIKIYETGDVVEEGKRKKASVPELSGFKASAKKLFKRQKPEIEAHAKILIAASSYLSKEFLLEIREKCEEVYIYEGCQILKETGTGRQPFMEMDPKRYAIREVARELDAGLEGILGNRDLWKLLWSPAGIDLSSVIQPYLADFIQKQIPIILRDYLFLDEFCEKVPITHILVGAEDAEPAILNLAQNKKKIRFIGMQGLPEGGNAESLRFYSNRFFTDWIAMDIPGRSLLEEEWPGFDRSARFHIRKDIWRESPAKIKEKDLLKHWVFMMSFYDCEGTILGSSTRSPGHLVSMRRKLIATLAKETDVDWSFWLLGPKQVVENAKEILFPQGTRHRVVINPDLSEIVSAVRVVSDSLSSHFMAVMRSKIPALYLALPELQLTELYREFLGPCYQEVKDSEQALEVIRVFKQSSSEDYCADIVVNTQDPIPNIFR